MKSDKKPWPTKYFTKLGKRLSDDEVISFEEDLVEITKLPKERISDLIRPAITRIAQRWSDTFRYPTSVHIANEIKAMEFNGTVETDTCCEICGGTGLIERCYHLPSIGEGSWICTCRPNAPELSRAVVELLDKAGQRNRMQRYLACEQKLIQDKAELHKETI